MTSMARSTVSAPAVPRLPLRIDEGETGDGGKPSPFFCAPMRGDTTMRTLIAAGLVCAMPASASAATFEEQLATCKACHGENGISETSEVPSLAGMPANFTLIQLYLFRAGTRKVEIMNDLAKNMTDADLQKFGDYFAGLTPPKAAGEAADPQVAARAQASISRN